MEFHSPTLKDKDWVLKAFDFGQTDCCEYCFGIHCSVSLLMLYGLCPEPKAYDEV